MDLNPKFTPVLVELDNAQQSITDSEPSISTKNRQGLRKMSSGVIPDPFSMETLTFNVGGKRFETYASTLDRDCNCLLSKKAFLQAHYRKDTGEYFFDRDPDIFKVTTVKILKFGTPQTIAIIVLKIEKFDVTLH